MARAAGVDVHVLQSGLLTAEVEDKQPHPQPLSKGEGSDYRQGEGNSERALAIQGNKGYSGYFLWVGYESSYLIPYNNNHIQRLWTTARAAPCNKSAMTDNPYPSHKMGAKPVHGIKSVFSWHQISVRMASNQCSYGIKSVFSRGRSSGLVRLKKCFQHCNAIEKDRSLSRK